MEGVLNEESKDQPSQCKHANLRKTIFINSVEFKRAVKNDKPNEQGTVTKFWENITVGAVV